jgi:hypothetical protein
MFGKMFEVLDDTGLLDVEVFGIVPQGDVAADALASARSLPARSASYALRRNRRQSLMRCGAMGRQSSMNSSPGP